MRRKPQVLLRKKRRQTKIGSKMAAQEPDDAPKDISGWRGAGVEGRQVVGGGGGIEKIFVLVGRKRGASPGTMNRGGDSVKPRTRDRRLEITLCSVLQNRTSASAKKKKMVNARVQNRLGVVNRGAGHKN